MNGQDAIAYFERKLLEHPRFGASPRILARLSDLLVVFLELLSETHVAFKTLHSRLAMCGPAERLKYLATPSVRLAIISAIGNSASEGGQIALDECINLAADEVGVSAAMSNRLLPDRWFPCVWAPHDELTRSDKTFLSICHKLMLCDSRGPLLTTIGTDCVAHEALSQAQAWISNLLPAVTESALDHTCLIVIVDAAEASLRNSEGRSRFFQSASTYRLPGITFLSRSCLYNVWDAAEALLHEGIHNKIFDLYLTRPILMEQYEAKKSERIAVPWNTHLDYESSNWPVDRSLAALHVYVHLTLFFLSVLTATTNISPAKREYARGRLQQSHQRGAYLYEELIAKKSSFRRDGT